MDHAYNHWTGWWTGLLLDWITGLLDLIFSYHMTLHSIMQMCRGFLFLLCCSFSATGVVILTTKLLKPLIDDCM